MSEKRAHFEVICGAAFMEVFFRIYRETPAGPQTPGPRINQTSPKEPARMRNKRHRADSSRQMLVGVPPNADDALISGHGEGAD